MNSHKYNNKFAMNKSLTTVLFISPPKVGGVRGGLKKQKGRSEHININKHYRITNAYIHISMIANPAEPFVFLCYLNIRPPLAPPTLGGEINTICNKELSSIYVQFTFIHVPFNKHLRSIYLHSRSLYQAFTFNLRSFTFPLSSIYVKFSVICVNKKDNSRLYSWQIRVQFMVIHVLNLPILNANYR